MVYKIVKLGHPVLEQVAEPVMQFDTPELHQLVDDMFETMYAHKGVGLAAPHVNVYAGDNTYYNMGPSAGLSKVTGKVRTDFIGYRSYGLD